MNMQNGIFFSIISLCYSILICIIFFSKERLVSRENSIYKRLLIINLVGLLIEIFPGTYAARVLLKTSPVLATVILKFILVYFITWIVTFTHYIIVISLNDRYDGKNISKDSFTILKGILFAIYIICLIFIWILPLYAYEKQGAAYTYGPSATLVYIISGILIGLWIVLLTINRKYIKDKKYIPIFAFIMIGIIVIIIQSKYPGITLMIPMQTFVTFLMYFTIENPDMQLINELNIAKDQAEKANNAKSDFLSSMSHEIRTPLNAIVGFSEALKDEDLSDRARDEVNDIIMASNSLLEIVNGILDISKIESGKIEIVNSEYQFREIFDNLVSLTKARMGDKGLDFRINYDNTIPAILYGDHTRVKQIILNVLTNAVKYTKEGYIDFSVSSIIKDDICRLVISVEDSGIGIKQENIEKLFKKFERFDLDKNITIEGTGLGMAITKKLVDLMNGNIIVQSKYGEGSKFTIALDQRIVNKEVVEKNVSEKDVVSEEINVDGKKVLIVDDNVINLKVASRLLEDYKLEIETADSGFTCINNLKQGKTYDLILMDDMMPKMSGVETLHKLKEDGNGDIPVIALTANAITGMRENYIKEGFNDYLAKPINKDELAKIISKYLNK